MRLPTVGLTLLLAVSCCPVPTTAAPGRPTAFTATVIGHGDDGVEVRSKDGSILILVGPVEAAIGTTLYVTGTVTRGNRVRVERASPL